MSSKTTGYKLTKADLRQINIRNLVGFQAGWNYERMQHSGYLWIILPQLRKIYGDNTEALKTACRTQCSPFFNTSNFLNTIITGIDLAIEETEGIDGLETVASLKTGLMGPLASIGDSIFGSLLPTIFGALAANMAIAGNPLGIVISAPIDLGGVTVDLQHICNMICPKLVPAALVGAVYWLLGRKGMTSTKAIFIVLIVAIVLGGLGWIAKG